MTASPALLRHCKWSCCCCFCLSHCLDGPVPSQSQLTRNKIDSATRVTRWRRWRTKRTYCEFNKTLFRLRLRARATICWVLPCPVPAAVPKCNRHISFLDTATIERSAGSCGVAGGASNGIEVNYLIIKLLPQMATTFVAVGGPFHVLPPLSALSLYCGCCSSVCRSSC